MNMRVIYSPSAYGEGCQYVGSQCRPLFDLFLFQNNTPGEPQHKSLASSNQHPHHSTKENAAMTGTTTTTTATLTPIAAMTGTTTTTTATLTPIAAPQPWSSLYYYSQLASQFGMSFADYPYIANTAFSGLNLAPSSPVAERSSPIHPQLRANCQASVDLSQGQGGREPSDLYNGGHGLTLNSPTLESSQSGVLLDGSAEVHIPCTTCAIPSPLGNQKSGVNVSGSSST